MPADKEMSLRISLQERVTTRRQTGQAFFKLPSPYKLASALLFSLILVTAPSPELD